MQYKVQPEDFIVEEQIRLPLAPEGGFAIYRVRKRSVTTLRVRGQMARALGVPQSAVIFPALKDKKAVAVQHAAVRSAGATDPERLTGNGFEAELLGRASRSLAPTDIVANRFAIVLRDLPAEETKHIRERLMQIAQSGLPNYFDQQRFGSVARSQGAEHIGKHILRRDAERALQAYFTQSFAGDPAPVRRFKAFAAGHWGDWDALFQAAPRPSNFRSVLTYLRDHPTSDPVETTTHYRKALNLITRRLLSIYLSAYQSLLWNRIAARYLAAQVRETPTHVEVAGEQLPLYHELPPHIDRGIAIPLPNHRAAYSDLDLAAVVAQVLAEENLTLNDLKARILKKAYLPKGRRTLLLFPRRISSSPPEPDERFPKQSKMTVAFTLPRGSYGTLVLKALGV